MVFVDVNILGGGGVSGVNGGGFDVVCINGGVVIVNNLDKFVGGKSGDIFLFYDNIGVVIYLKDSRRVMFVEDIKLLLLLLSSSFDFFIE